MTSAHNPGMGDTQMARIHRNGASSSGEVLLETAELIFRGEQRFVLPFSSIRTVAAEDGRLILNDGEIVLELGDAAVRWAEKIRNPKTVVQKLGIKPGQSVLVLNLEDPQFAADLAKAGASVATNDARGVDALFYGAGTREALENLAALTKVLAPAGALWIIRPKGVKTITENDVMQAGRAAGLVDVKVVRFSATHTAEKFVIPIAKR